MIPEQFYDTILKESNRYAEQQRALKNDTSEWNPICKEELMAFIGINIAMGIISLPSLDDYWSTDPILGSMLSCLVISLGRF